MRFTINQMGFHIATHIGRWKWNDRTQGIATRDECLSLDILQLNSWTRVRNEQQVNRKRISETMRTNCENDLRGRFEPAVCHGAVDWMKCACWMLVPQPQMCSAQLSMNIGFHKKLRYSIHHHLPAAPKAIAGAPGAPLPMITIWIIQTWFGVDSVGIFVIRRMHAEAYLIGTTASEHRWIFN